MRELVLTAKFRRAYKKFVAKDRRLQKAIDNTLVAMSEDIFAPALGSHKLSGELYGLWACSCGYDCRIVFVLEPDPNTHVEVILLLDLGTHDDVY
jgi:mRNA-degrading endonuclease YafQ of YafQ-DinJ toxin-antitoxin module